MMCQLSGECQSPTPGISTNAFQNAGPATLGGVHEAIQHPLPRGKQPYGRRRVRRPATSPTAPARVFVADATQCREHRLASGEDVLDDLFMGILAATGHLDEIKDVLRAVAATPFI